jgi:hypothetical protein
MAERIDDQELQAIQQVIAALSELDAGARTRVIDYVFQRLGLKAVTEQRSVVPPSDPTEVLSPAQIRRRQVDVRSFGTEKSPRSANERVAVVAYYLTELAPETERKAEISAADITKYFKQAGFPLPGAARMTLVNARNAGYLDAQERTGVGATHRQTGERGSRDSHPGAHVLFAPGDAWRAGEGHPGTGRTPGPGHDTALHAPEPSGARRGDSVVGDGHRRGPRGRGEIVEAAGTEGPKAHLH